MSLLLADIWKYIAPHSRKHELLREELYAAINSLDEVESDAARSMLMMFNGAAGGYHEARARNGEHVRYVYSREVCVDEKLMAFQQRQAA